MKKVIIVMLVSLAAASMLSAQQPANKRKPITPEQYAANLERFLTKTGGYIIGPLTGRNVVIANTQNVVSDKVFENAASGMFDGPHLVAKVIKADRAQLAGMLAEDSTGVMVQVVDEADTPTLLVAPDARGA